MESKLKNKNWQDKYVDFAKLLPFREENDDTEGFQIQTAGKLDFKILKTKNKRPKGPLIYRAPEYNVPLFLGIGQGDIFVF